MSGQENQEVAKKAEPAAEGGTELSNQDQTEEAAENEVDPMDEEEPDDGVPRVLVTGASGYIASLLTKALLQDGRFRIRGTVRNKKKKEKVFTCSRPGVW